MTHRARNKNNARTKKPLQTAHRYRQKVIFASLVTIWFGAIVMSAQLFTLWLPFTWAHAPASNVTLWPQISLPALIILVVTTVWLSVNKHRAGWIFGVISALCVTPYLIMVIGLQSYANTHNVPITWTEFLHDRRMPYEPRTADKSVVFGRVDGVPLYASVYRPVTPTNNAFKRQYPTVVYVHGGGWNGGSRTDNNELFRWLNNHGYLVVSVDYRRAKTLDPTWQKAPQDIACAFSWLNTTKNYPIDRRDVTVIGMSAGGQLAMRSAYGIANNDVTSSCGGMPLTPRRVVGIVPAVDFYDLYNDPRLGPTSQKNVMRYLGGTPVSAPNAYYDQTIKHHVTARVPPTLLINAGNDTLVSPQSGEELAARLRASGVYTEHYTIPYAAHSYWINPGGYQNQIANELIRRFLRKS